MACEKIESKTSYTDNPFSVMNLEKGVQLGNAQAMYSLALDKEFEIDGVPQDIMGALRLYRMAQSKGNRQASERLSAVEPVMEAHLMIVTPIIQALEKFQNRINQRYSNDQNIQKEVEHFVQSKIQECKDDYKHRYKNYRLQNEGVIMLRNEHPLDVVHSRDYLSFSIKVDANIYFKSGFLQSFFQNKKTECRMILNEELEAIQSSDNNFSLGSKMEA